ncbi:unnamed protein product [Musa acuminata subsp. burmannicoides]
MSRKKTKAAKKSVASSPSGRKGRVLSSYYSSSSSSSHGPPSLPSSAHESPVFPSAAEGAPASSSAGIQRSPTAANRRATRSSQGTHASPSATHGSPTFPSAAQEAPGSYSAASSPRTPVRRGVTRSSTTANRSVAPSAAQESLASPPALNESLDSPSAAQESPASSFATRSAPVTRSMTRSATIANMRATRSASKAGGIRLLDGLTNEQLEKRKATPAKRHSSDRRKGKDNTTDDNQEKDKPSAGGAASVGPYTIFVEASNLDGKFLKAAKNVTSALNSAFPSISTKVVVEPRKGCFKVHDEEGEIFLQYLDLEEPYSELESIDIPKAVKDVGRKIG